MIEITDLHRWFGSLHAVRGVGFSIPPGQTVGLLGPNGAGKTTTLRMLTGILRPHRGTIRIGGVDSLAHPIQARCQFGYLPESAPSYPEMSVKGYLRFRAGVLGVPPGQRHNRVGAVMDECQLTGVAGRRIGQLSKGYRQRVALAASLVHDPKVLILDEPTNGLDPTQIREARSLIGDLARGRTVLVSSHILPEIERTCQRVLIVGAGRVLADGTPSELCRLSSGGGCIAECKEDGTPLVNMLSGALPGCAVTTEPMDEGWSRCTVRGEGEITERVGRALHSAGLTVRLLRPEVTGLEEAFVRVLESAPEERP